MDEVPDLQQESRRDDEPREPALLPEAGSFRDPDSRVAYADGRVVRVLSERGRADWEALAATGFFERSVAEGRIVGTTTLDPASAPPGTGGLLAHERIPFLSYPYEWPFGMLREAALLELELLLAALDEGLILKDASPYNVQWRGASPVFIDVGSFEPLREGEPWAGYRQFCMLFLFPLMLQAYREVAFQPWLRGSIDGIAPAELARVLTWRDRLRAGVLAHVVLHARLERRNAGRAGEVKEELRAAGFSSELIRANARRLAGLVRRLRWEPPATGWAGYGEATHYSAEDAARKDEFVRLAAGARRRGLVWDLGCNEGRHARIAAEDADCVVAMDADPGVAERLYRALRSEGNRTVLPLTLDLADPSPARGWRGVERKSLLERGRPELTLCLALLHHLAVARNVPVPELVDWLRGLGSSVVVEFATRDDPMVQRLLAAKRQDSHPDYDLDRFERRLGEAFRVERTERLASGTRVLYLAHPA